MGFTRSAYWLRLQLDNPGAQSVQRMLEIGYPLLSNVPVFTSRGPRGTQSTQTGGAPVCQPPLRPPLFLFPSHCPHRPARWCTCGCSQPTPLWCQPGCGGWRISCL
ncbi:MAG: hypothetical protein IPN06_10005 [Burkholderiales bacterium]|nr:hypothetical protein [Burkholderiales bacterium]